MLMSYLSKNWIMYRQALAFSRILKLPCSAIVRAAPGIKKVAAFFIMLGQLLGAMFFDYPTTPDGPMLDLDARFDLVWQDEFNGDQLDYNRWGGHYIYGFNHAYERDNSWWHMGQVRVEGDNLIITAEWKEDGVKGPAFYTAGIDTSPNHMFYPESQGYEQLYGYFEVRCKWPDGDDMGPAFWLLCEGMFLKQPTGVVGSEIDVFETHSNSKHGRWSNSVFSTIHIGGYGEGSNHKNQNVGHFYTHNPTSEFNTYGVEWNEKEYIFYINGQETARTDFKGPSQVPMYMILDIGVGFNAKKEQMPQEFVVDYVRAYQYKEGKYPC